MVKALKPDALVKVSFNVESREFNGKWYTDLRVWKIEPTRTSRLACSRNPAISRMPDWNHCRQKIQMEKTTMICRLSIPATKFRIPARTASAFLQFSYIRHDLHPRYTLPAGSGARIFAQISYILPQLGFGFTKDNRPVLRRFF